MRWYICLLFISAILNQVQGKGERIQAEARRSAMCYNCTNEDDPHNYCNHSDIENMPTAYCSTEKCLYYVIQRVFIDEVSINRSCMTHRLECQQLRDYPGNDVRQCIICSWDLCNGGQQLLHCTLILLISLIAFIIDYL